MPKKPRKFDYNLVVIGAGAAGLVSAYIASAIRARVALIERGEMGGDCLNTGCVPSKALIRAARLAHDAAHGAEFGIGNGKPEVDFEKVMAHVHRAIREIEPHDSVERYTSLGVECIRGDARILDPWHVSVAGRTLSTKAIVVATGAEPLVPGIPGLKDSAYLTSETLWKIRELPKRLVVLGGGPIGCELTQAFARLGAEVTLVEAAPRILSKEDEDAAALIMKTFSSEGIRVLTGHPAVRVESGRLICRRDQAEEVAIPFDQLLVALGRKARVTGFGLEELGVTISAKGTIANDPFLRTSVPNIYVCGDVAGPYQFTHTAAHQSWYAAVNALFSPFKKFKADYRVIPWATFTDPEVARVGLSEDEARAQGTPYRVTRYPLEDLDRAIADGDARGFVKILTPPGSDRILGATIVGPHASDILSEFVLAMKYGLGLNKILGTIHTYPTYPEAAKMAAGVWKKETAPAGALRILEKFHRFRRGGARA